MHSALAEHRQSVIRAYPTEPCPPQDEYTLWAQSMGYLAQKLPIERRRAVMNHLMSLMQEQQADHVPALSYLDL